MRELLSPKQVAQAIGVSEASLKRWCDKGLIPFQRTQGGHRRIPVSGVMNYLRDRDIPLARPDILGLPSATSESRLAVSRARQLIIEALKSGDVEVFRQIGFNLFLSGHSVQEICDEVLAPAFHAVGDLWQHGEMEVYQERRGVEICLEFLIELRASLPDPPANAPLAICATIRDDLYSLPPLMVEVVLKSLRWRAEFYGCGLPLHTLLVAVQQKQPRMLSLSVSTIDITEELRNEWMELFRCCEEHGTALAVGGRAMNEEIMEIFPSMSWCKNLAMLTSFARVLQPER